MELDFDQLVFPRNVIQEITTELDSTYRNVHVFSRRLRLTDPSISIGIFGDDWSPNLDSHEMAGRFPGDPVLSTYRIVAQTLIIDTDEERGLGRHYVLASTIRSMLADSAALAVKLVGTTSVRTNQYLEALRKWSSTSQKYYSSEMGSSKWGYLSVLQINIETELRRIA